MTLSHALLLTDVVDSTRLEETLGSAEANRLWSLHDRAARDLLPPWRGREIDKADGMLLLFDRVADAVGYALAYHHALAALALPFRARAGIHFGAVNLRANSPADIALGAKPVEVDGLAKSVVARVMAVARGGQTLLTDAARQALDLPALRWVSHGQWRLAGLAEPVELVEVGDASADFLPPPDAPKAYRVVRHGELWLPAREIRHSLPAERDAFVGRAQPLQALAQRLQQGARLITVVGTGGTGKTRLVTRYGWSWLGEHPGGVWFCDLAQARGLDGIAYAVAQGLGVALGGTDPVTQLGHAIVGRGDCLLVLDNFEQVAPWAEETLGRWLEKAPQARFLATSRARLDIVGEETLELPPLPPEEAAGLFLRRAEAARQGYQPGADDRAAIDRLVQVLDGLPLAIELAAARVRLLAPRAMLARMHERFALLVSRGGRRDRQATLRAAFDWGWDLLAEAERVALAQLSVFRGGFTVEAAEGVLALDGCAPPLSAADALQGLIDKSFVRTLAGERFDLLQSVRDYAAEHLRTPGRFAGSGPAARSAAEARHGRYFAALGPERAVERSCIELDNLVAACRRAAARADVDVALRTLVGAWAGLNRRGPFRVGVELAVAVRALPDLGAQAGVEADLIGATALLWSGRGAEFEALAIPAAAAAASLGDPVLEGRALHTLAVAQARAGQIEVASASFDRALALLHGREPSRECDLLNALGQFCESLGRLGQAQQHYEAGLRLARAAGHRRWQGGAAGNLAQFWANQGNETAALPLYEQAVQIASELGDRRWEANSRCNLGLLHFGQRRYAQAQTELSLALEAAREMGHANLLAIVQCNLGLVAESLGAPDEALAYHEASVALARDTGDRRSEGQILGYLGLLHARQARYAQARLALEAGEVRLRSVYDRVSLGILLCARAEAEHLAGHEQVAGEVLLQADRLASELDDLPPESEFGLALSRTRGVISAC
jgi:predicted ATPase/class 3 adenylate cyclase/uncharacterized protein HemY